MYIYLHINIYYLRALIDIYMCLIVFRIIFLKNYLF